LVPSDRFSFHGPLQQRGQTWFFDLLRGGLEGGDALGEGSLALSLSKLLLVEALRLARELGGLLGVGGVLADSGMGSLVDLLQIIRVDLLLNEASELTLVGLGVLLLELLHVLSNVTTEDVLAENVSVELLILSVVTSKTASAVGDIETTIGGTLHGGEDTVTSGGTSQTNVQQDGEGLGSILEGLDDEVLTSGVRLTLVLVSKLQLGQNTTSEEETSGIGCKIQQKTDRSE
jgi:hypothetical protein